MISLTGDKASVNQTFFQMNQSANKTEKVHKIRNPYSIDGSYIYFISDVPHLIKTTRNCWENSFGHSYKRAMWVSQCSNNTACIIMHIIIQINGKHISWEHLCRLYNRRTASGLTRTTKLTREHIALNSYSRMKVHLAAQVLCKYQRATIRYHHTYHAGSQ